MRENVQGCVRETFVSVLEVPFSSIFSNFSREGERYYNQECLYPHAISLPRIVFEIFRGFIDSIFHGTTFFVSVEAYSLSSSQNVTCPYLKVVALRRAIVFERLARTYARPVSVTTAYRIPVSPIQQVSRKDRMHRADA